MERKEPAWKHPGPVATRLWRLLCDSPMWSTGPPFVLRFIFKCSALRGGNMHPNRLSSPVFKKLAGSQNPLVPFIPHTQPRPWLHLSLCLPPPPSTCPSALSQQSLLQPLLQLCVCPQFSAWDGMLAEGRPKRGMIGPSLTSSHLVTSNNC